MTFAILKLLMKHLHIILYYSLIFLKSMYVHRCHCIVQYDTYYVYMNHSTKLTFQAQRNNFTYPKYAWIAYDWYPRRWWTHEESNIEVGCSDQELAKFLQKVISLRVRPVLDDKNATTDAGIVSIISNVFMYMYSTA